ncbi:hypothetical protein [Nitrosovibrio sp. Nv4]|uniref:hypothetical protein n=1 Tax=Nitrosovibrio sp. Nv4 TaxID=1945880 RepID=UPI000BD53621|nr:hypothetical protein [Nitrosovibrio sp. Nv4]SOD41686.1 hypothetical protein SAMN06298226_1988 [Nitrosovibrio sp. Nv4]
MTKTNEKNGSPDKAEHLHHRVRLPGFIADEEIGLGDAVKRATSFFGIQPCRGCARRAAALDRWLVFINRRSK